MEMYNCLFSFIADITQIIGRPPFAAGFYLNKSRAISAHNFFIAFPAFNGGFPFFSELLEAAAVPDLTETAA